MFLAKMLVLVAAHLVLFLKCSRVCSRNIFRVAFNVFADIVQVDSLEKDVDRDEEKAQENIVGCAC